MSEPPDVIETAVLIVGAGAAGLRAAIELADRRVPCVVFGKRAHGDAHTRWAAGGINAVLGSRDPDDRWELHFADTIREGHFVCDPRAVELLCQHAPAHVRQLREWGCAFNETADGEIDQRYFGAQSFRRTCFAGDRTGEAIMAALVERARALGIPYREHLFVTRLLVSGRRVTGALAIDLDSGRATIVRTPAVVLAAGGYTAIYGRSSSRKDENTGDAAALALEAGASLRDMEFVQFHPTGMVAPADMRGRLVTEAVRGEGGRLFNAAGERFMERYAPERLELDARDVVARAIYQEIHEGRGTPAGAVYLDISHQAPEVIAERLPKIARQFGEQGVDIRRTPMEVAPTAHYAMGGILVDFETGRTTVEGLFAVGEATAGAHGANRLGGNSLAETVVFGQITGASVAAFVAGRRSPRLDERIVGESVASLEALSRTSGPHDPERLAEELGHLLWTHAGIVRSARGLRQGLDALADLETRAGKIGVDGPRSGQMIWALNLRAMLTAAEALLRSALLRDESRGAHFRADATMELSRWQRNIVCTRTDRGALHVDVHAVPPVPPELQRFLDEKRDIDYHHLE